MYRKLLVTLVAVGAIGSACTSKAPESVKLAAASPTPTCVVPRSQAPTDLCSAKTMAGQRGQGSRLRDL